VLLGHQTAVNRRELPTLRYAATNLAATSALLGGARLVGLGVGEVGLAPGDLRRGPARGAAVGLAGAAGLSVVLAVPRLRPLLRDARLAQVGRGELAARVLVRIPLGTVVLEEVAFRGVLPAALRRAALPAWLADVAFGLWHVPPALVTARVNGVTSARGRWSAAGAAVTATTVAGALCRQLARDPHGGGVPATAVAHAVLNGAATLASVAAHHDARDQAPSRLSAPSPPSRRIRQRSPGGGAQPGGAA